MGPVVLLYNIPAEKEAAIRSLCQKLSVQVVKVSKSRHGCTIGEALRGEGVDRPAKRSFDEEMLVLGCLLPDIGYVLCKTQEDYNYHGRLSAGIAREFLLG